MMGKLFGRSMLIGGMLAAALSAQNRQATIVGGGSPDRGKCTIEVTVDDTAQVEVRGSTAVLRTIAGQPAQWRRFECTAPMPAAPANFRFSGVDGRGRQSLVQDPRNGGAAVVRIEDKDGGAEGYTFDLQWGGGGGTFSEGNQPRNAYPQQQQGYPQQGYQQQGAPGYGDADRGGRRDDDRRDYRPDYGNSDYYRRYHHPFSTEEAVRVCQNAVAEQAQQRFRTGDVHFHGTRIDDNPGRNDWIMGTLDVHRGPRGEERFSFSCSVNFDTGRVRSATIDQRPLDGDRWWR